MKRSFTPLPVIAALLHLGCGGALGTGGAPALATDPVDIGTWCAELGEAYCPAMGERCFGGGGSSFADGVSEGCRETFLPSCVGGADPSAPSGRTYGELPGCVALIESSSCAELGGMMADPGFAARCQVAPDRFTVASVTEPVAPEAYESSAPLPTPQRLLGHWAAAPPPSQRRSFLIARYALADPPREAEFAQMTPTPQEEEHFYNVIKLRQQEPGSPLLAQLRERLSSLRAIRATFTPTKLITQTPSGVTVNRYQVEEDLGDALVILEEGSGPLEERRRTITFLDDDSLILAVGPTRVEMERLPPPAATGDVAFDQCVAEYFACLRAMPPVAREAMGASVDGVRALVERSGQTPEGRQSFTETCQSSVALFRAAGYCE